MSSRMLQLLHETSFPSPTAPGAIRRCISAAAQWQGRDDAGCSTSGNFESLTPGVFPIRSNSGSWHFKNFAMRENNPFYGNTMKNRL